MSAYLELHTKENKVLKKHSALIGISSVVTAQQRKAFNVLLYVACSNMLIDVTKTKFEVPIYLLKRLTGIDATNNQQIKESVWGLMCTVVELNTLGHASEWNWRATTLLSDATILKKGILEFSFSPAVMESLLTPSTFAMLNLDIVKRLRSKYAIGLYELGRDYLHKEWPVISIEDFRRFMGFKEGSYANFADLRKRVIDLAISEINSKTDLKLGYEPVCAGRKVIGLKISVEETNGETLLPDNVDDLNVVYELTPGLLPMTV